MNIVISSKRYHPILGGSVQFVDLLAKAFTRSGHSVKILTRTHSADEDDGEIPVYRNPTLARHFSLARWADKLIQVDASWKDVWPFIICRVPWYPTVHFGKDLTNASLRKIIAVHMLQLAFYLGKTIPVGHEVARSWGLVGEPIQNPYDDDIFHMPDEASARDIDLLFVGRIERSKGVFVLVDALNAVLPSVESRVRCVFIGDGEDLPALRERILEIDRLAEVTLTSRLRPYDVAGWMRRSKVLVFPTTPEWTEASPLTPLEALACGCHVIASDNGGTKENIGPSGVLVRSGSVDSLSSALRKELANPHQPDRVAVEKFLQSRRLDTVGQLYVERISAHN